ncbi:histidine-rich glycoprotein [Drosophila erecta]|uniref:Uncharacterized protein n=1 Tax=Drosophila erecta TaxID=7220 RepID=B3NS76_DROER|nr:histidine-rich glycoprotein [Drosophila erecta]EDV56378.1 uncharacterized protein Dere_GG22603 [Drosophila erecta]
MLKAIIVFATILLAVALAMQPLEDNERNHHLNHKRQLSHHHQKSQEVRHSAHDNLSPGKELHQSGSHVKEHAGHGQSHHHSQRKARQSHKEPGHKKSHHQKSQSHSKGSKKHHKRHTGSRRH